MGLNKFMHLIDNELAYPPDRHFACIIGSSPSKGARSPLLWNAAFTGIGFEAQMLPFDVSDANLPELLNLLESDPLFLGGAIAVPYKETIARWLGERVTPEAKAIGAVNCLYRGETGKLHGTNTDGEASLAAFERQFGSVSGKKILLMGPGGAGKAVAAYFGKAIDAGNSAGLLQIISRKLLDGNFLSAIEAEPALGWPVIDSVLSDLDAVINCTTIGSGEQLDKSPLSIEQLGKLPAHAIVYDIIYQPAQSLLLKQAEEIGLQTLNGEAMNLGQAVLAFQHAVANQSSSCSKDSVRRVMQDAAKAKKS